MARTGRRKRRSCPSPPPEYSALFNSHDVRDIETETTAIMFRDNSEAVGDDDEAFVDDTYAPPRTPLYAIEARWRMGVDVDASTSGKDEAERVRTVSHAHASPRNPQLAQLSDDGVGSGSDNGSGGGGGGQAGKSGAGKSKGGGRRKANAGAGGGSVKDGGKGGSGTRGGRRRGGGGAGTGGKKGLSKVNTGEGRDKVTNGNNGDVAAAAAVVVTAGLEGILAPTRFRPSDLVRPSAPMFRTKRGKLSAGDVAVTAEEEEGENEDGGDGGGGNSSGDYTGDDAAEVNGGSVIVGHENYHQLSECTDWPLDSLDAELHGVVSQLEEVSFRQTKENVLVLPRSGSISSSEYASFPVATTTMTTTTSQRLESSRMADRGRLIIGSGTAHSTAPGNGGGFVTAAQRKERRDAAMAAAAAATNDTSSRSFNVFHSEVGPFQNETAGAGAGAGGYRDDVYDGVNGGLRSASTVPSSGGFGVGVRLGSGHGGLAASGTGSGAGALGSISIGGHSLSGQQMLKDQKQRSVEAAAAAVAAAASQTTSTLNYPATVRRSLGGAVPVAPQLFGNGTRGARWESTTIGGACDGVGGGGGSSLLHTLNKHEQRRATRLSFEGDAPLPPPQPPTPTEFRLGVNGGQGHSHHHRHTSSSSAFANNMHHPSYGTTHGHFSERCAHHHAGVGGGEGGGGRAHNLGSAGAGYDNDNAGPLGLHRGGGGGGSGDWVDRLQDNLEPGGTSSLLGEIPT